MRKIKIKNSGLEYNVGKIVCIGKNYTEHIKELGHDIEDKPVIFLKPVSSMIYSGDKVIHPSFSNNLHYEAELVLLIGKTIKDADFKEAEYAILAYGVGLDMTLRDIQIEARTKGNPWTISKGFDTSTVVSDFILKKDYRLSLDEFISLSVNGAVKQKERLKNMLFNPVELVQYVSSLMTLEIGDLIFTGTPAGVGRVVIGDKIKANIGKIIELETEVT